MINLYSYAHTISNQNEGLIKFLIKTKNTDTIFL